MHLTCPDCGADVPVEEINLDRGLARCSACNAVIDVEAALREIGFRSRPPVSRPRAITIEDLGTGLRLTRRWFTWGVVPLTVFCVFWDTVLVVWYTMALRPGAPWVAAVFPLLHLAVGVLLTYTALGIWLNRTVLEIDEGRLTVRHGPLPWGGKRDVSLAELEQLYCEKKVPRGRPGVTTYAYKVCGLLKGDRRVTLLDNLRDRDQALFVEQFVEQYLGIDDQPVSGELPRL